MITKVRNYNVSSLKRKRVYLRDQGICRLCWKPFAIEDGNIDHIIPLSKGGSNHISNLWFTCRPCNGHKGSALIYYDFRKGGYRFVADVYYKKGTGIQRYRREGKPKAKSYRALKVSIGTHLAYKKITVPNNNTWKIKLRRMWNKSKGRLAQGLSRLSKILTQP